MRRQLHDCLPLPLNDPLPPGQPPTETFAIGFPFWKHDFMRRYFPGRHLHFVPLYPGKRDAKQWQNRIAAAANREILVWGPICPPPYQDLAERHHIGVLYMEDGFLRSRRKSASRTAPLSLTLDRQRPYFDCRGASDLEDILANAQFDASQIERSRRAIDFILASGLTKYNGGGGKAAMPQSNGTEKRILVVGQVEQDASIRFGLSRPMTNNDLVRLARAENPQAVVIYRPHPDVLARVRQQVSDPADVANICHVDTAARPLAEVLAGVDHVYTMTSLVGFEALLRGMHVTVMGAPFYSGWGLTDDRQDTGRRHRKLSIEELFLGAYVLYPLYFDPCTGIRWTIEQAMDWLMNAAVDDRADLVSIQLAGRPAWKAWGEYGIMGWRHALTPLLARVVARIGNADDADYFRSNPVRFFRELSSPPQRLAGRILYPFGE